LRYLISNKQNFKHLGLLASKLSLVGHAALSVIGITSLRGMYTECEQSGLEEGQDYSDEKEVHVCAGFRFRKCTYDGGFSKQEEGILLT